ncbi:MAG: hypothetical protein GKR89_29260 [Candidatus Latescibacteria bacterium]|nr:hypothetical protein [Candidatus Latescibacterota bacterium]
MANQEQVDQYRDQGYFIVDDAVEEGMLEELAVAADRVVAKVRSGEVVDDESGIGTGGEGTEPQFVTGLIAPQFGEPVFGQYLGSAGIARYLRPFLGDELRLGWVHLCAVAGDYRGGWHRDMGGAERDASHEEELALLAQYRKHMVKWHLALVDDPSLWIVPGSQRRCRTEHERQVLTQDPMGTIPAGRQINLRRGQTIFWNGNTIHRGWKPDGVGARSSLMGGMIDHRAAYQDSEKGDQAWLMAANIRPSLPPRTQRYYDNWRALAEPRMTAG